MYRIRLISCAVLLLAAAVILWAATGTVAPDSDVATGGFATAPLWSKINEDIDSPDGTVITSGNNPGSLVSFGVSCPSDVGTITAATLRIRARQNDVARNISLAVAWSATEGTSFSTGTLNKTDLQNYAGSEATGLSISKSACQASTMDFTPTTTGSGPAATATVDTFNLDITYTTGPTRKKNPIVVISRATLRPVTR